MSLPPGPAGHPVHPPVLGHGGRRHELRAVPSREAVARLHPVVRGHCQRRGSGTSRWPPGPVRPPPQPALCAHPSGIQHPHTGAAVLAGRLQRLMAGRGDDRTSTVTTSMPTASTNGAATPIPSGPGPAAAVPLPGTDWRSRLSRAETFHRRCEGGRVVRTQVRVDHRHRPGRPTRVGSCSACFKHRPTPRPSPPPPCSTSARERLGRGDHPNLFAVSASPAEALVLETPRHRRQGRSSPL